jgi:all-trans-8'-apo-beta-carotenal 15,15'-oxygenase
MTTTQAEVSDDLGARHTPLVTPAARPAIDDDDRDLSLLLWSQGVPREHGFEPLTVEGRIPDELRGTLYRNGPGQFEQFGRRYSHPFEADGALTALRIDDHGASAAVRITDSRGLRQERAAGRHLYGGDAPWWRRFGNALRGRVKNTANTSVLSWQGRLFALMEAGKPTEIDPHDLRTLGETDLDGTIVSWFSAHPHRVASRRTTYNFGLEIGRQPRLHVYALPDQGAAERLTEIDLDGPVMLHDFVASDDHLIFFVSPVRIDVPRALLALRDFGDMLTWRPEMGTEVIVVPIDHPCAAVRFRTDAFFQWHFANAFRHGRGLIVDYVRYPDLGSFYELGRPADGPGLPPSLAAGRYHRAVIDLDRLRLTSQPLWDQPCEYPRVHPRVEGGPHRYTWLTLGDMAGIGRLDDRGEMAEHRLPRHQRASEPVFVPRAGGRDESDGHVLVLCYDGGRDQSFLAIYDGRRIGDGPVARLWLDHRVPVTFHGSWVAQGGPVG